MSALENAVAGLFNFDPSIGISRGTDAGNGMMRIALESQRQQFQVAQDAANAQLQAERNQISKRSQMFNQLTDTLNRADKNRAQSQSAANNAAIAEGYSAGSFDSGGGSGQYGYGGVSPYPSSESNDALPTYDSAGYYGPDDSSFSGVVADNTGFNESEIPTAPEPSFRMGSSDSIAGTQNNITFNDAPSGRTPQPNVSFSGDAPSLDPIPEQNITLGSQPEGGSPTATPLTADEKGRVSPVSVYAATVNKVKASKLNGMVPRDGERYGITTGSPEEWGRYMTGLAELESSFNTGTVGDVGRFPGNSNGLFQLSPNDALNHKLQEKPFSMEQLRDPEQNLDAAIKIHERLISEDGVIAAGNRGAARYWGPLRRGIRPHLRDSAKAIPLSGTTGPSTPSVRAPSGALFPETALPEYQAKQKAQADLERTTAEKAQVVSNLTRSRSRLMQAQSALSLLDKRAPNYAQAANPLLRDIAQESAKVSALENRNQEIKKQEATLQKSLVDATGAFEIAGSRARIGGIPDPQSALESYANASFLERQAMRLRTVGDDNLSEAFDRIDKYESSQQESTAETEEVTYKIGSADYTIPEIVQFIQTEPVQEFLSKNPKVAAQVEAMASTQQASEPAAPTSGIPQSPTVDGGIRVKVGGVNTEGGTSDPVKAQIDKDLGF